MKGWCQLALKVFLYTCGAGESLVSVNAPGPVNLPVSALSNGSGNGSAT